MNESTSMEDLEKRFGAVRAMVLGDVMLDRYWSGSVERISPESPVPVVDVTEINSRLGGAANVAANVAGLGAGCLLVSIVGDDESGRVLRELLDDAGIEHRISTSADIRTTEKLRVVARNQQLLRIDFESRPREELLARTLDEVASRIDDIDVLVLSDYGKGGLDHIERVIELAGRHERAIVVDPKGSDYARYRGASLVTPNLREFELAGGDLRSEDAMCDSAAALAREFELGGLLVTRSEKGMTLYNPDGSKLHSPATAREVYDVSGAGDTVAAVVAVGIAAGLSPADVLELANRAAGQVIAKFGTAVVDLATLLGAGHAGETA